MYHFSKGKLTPFNQFWGKTWDLPHKKIGLKNQYEMCIQYYRYYSMQV
jgi:hypothetical protein